MNINKEKKEKERKKKKKKRKKGKEIEYEPFIADFGISVFPQESFGEQNKNKTPFIQAFSIRYAAPEVTSLFFISFLSFFLFLFSFFFFLFFIFHFLIFIF